MTRSLGDWLRHLEQLHPRSVDLGLERCGRVFRRLGAPRLATRVWTVAGTNGKGSVSAFLSGLAAASGHTVGCYTSPHILRFNERIRINGLCADDLDIVRALECVDEARGEVSLTYFEFTTLAAFLLFAERNLDSVVLEVGLGGRLDAVNLVDADCAVITPIGLDHCEYLGNDRDSIAGEKAGVMRAGQPAIIGDRQPPERLWKIAREVGAIPLYLGKDFDVDRKDDNASYSGPGVHDLTLPRLPLSGDHQWDNLATALAAFTALDETTALDPEWLSGALQAVRLPGRLQRWATDDRILLDVGHNPLAAEVVSDYLGRRPDRKCVCVLGMLADKDVEAVAGILSARVAEWFCAGLDGERGQPGPQLAQRVRRQLPSAAIQEFGSVSEALAAARAAAESDTTILVFGSFQTVQGAMVALQAEGDQPVQYW